MPHALPRPPRAAAPLPPRRTVHTLLRHIASATALLLALPAGAAQPLGCLIEALRSTDVGSPVIGVVQDVAVERGDVVKKGQVLAVLRAAVERASLNVASSRAESVAEVQAAQSAARFNRERRMRAEDLFRQNFISQQALDQARAESVQADQKLAMVREQRVMSRQERDVAAAQLSQRVIRSPFDGVIAERYVSAGERVDDKPIVRVSKVDPLRVQLVVPVSMYAEVQTGAFATVQPELPGAAAAQARVTMVDKVVDPASNTFRVHLELPNPNGALPAGLRCKAQFGAASATPAPASTAGPAPASAARAH